MIKVANSTMIHPAGEIDLPVRAKGDLEKGRAKVDLEKGILNDGRIRCASLDVCDPEPLPAGDWLYSHPGVRLSPHNSWNTPAAFDLLLDTFIDNLRRYRAGKVLDGIVDIEAGY